MIRKPSNARRFNAGFQHQGHATLEVVLSTRSVDLGEANTYAMTLILRL